MLLSISPESDKAIAAVLNRALEGANAAGDFLKEKLPDVLQQLLLWNIWKHSLVVALYLTVMVLSVLLIRKAWKENWDEAVAAFVTFVGIFACVIFSLIMISSLFELVQLLVAPKVWLLEYAANLLKS